MSNTISQDIIAMDFAEGMKTAFRDYAVSVIISRALPDIRDGLKPVQRRIMYAMSELGLDPKKPHRKSARIVGDTMGKYHPHGDSSIYDALVHMSEDYSLSLPLVDGHGNFGSIDGDGAAAMRYTEARLSEAAMTMLENLDNGLVEFMPNFDDSEKEPTVLPATLPNLLINGTTGIAVGMATNIPPHNPGEVIDGVIAYMDNPDISLDKMMKYIPGPDFPTGGIITNSSSIRDIYANSEGKLRVRARTLIENGDNGKKNIVITEIPYTVAGNKSRLVENLANLLRDKVFEEISDIRDESSKEGIRIVIEVKRDRDVNNLLNGLLKKTSMEDTYGVNLLAVKEKQPYQFSLLDMIKEFVLFQEDIYTKQYKHLLTKANNRLEIISGLVRATDIIDLIIEILRGSTSVKQAKDCLTKGDLSDIKFKSETSRLQAFRLDFTERQADAILAMPLSRLIGLEILKLHEEYDALLKQKEEYEDILGNKQHLYQVIKQTLKEYKKRFGYPRRTELADANITEYVEEFKLEEFYVLVDKFGYVKSIDATSYGKIAEENLREFVHTVKMNNTDKLCVFTAEGNMYQVKAAAIPRCRIKEKGTLIQNLCKLDKEDVLLYIAFEELFESQLLFATTKGFIKLVSGIEFETGRSMIASTKLDDDDKLCSITPLSAKDILADNYKVIMLTKHGLSLGFPVNEVTELKKTSRGVKGISLDDNDTVVFATALSPDEPSFKFNNKEFSAKKVRMRKRAARGQKASL